MDAEIEQRVDRFGADGRLMLAVDGSVYQVSLLEKILVTLLAKIGNFIPDTGIWMNTQRPEWNVPTMPWWVTAFLWLPCVTCIAS